MVDFAQDFGNTKILKMILQCHNKWIFLLPSWLPITLNWGQNYANFSLLQVF